MTYGHWFRCVRLAAADAEDKGRLAGMISLEDCGAYRVAGTRHSRTECGGCEQWPQAEAGEGLKTAREMFAGAVANQVSSSVCRYGVLRCLADGKPRKPAEIARAVGVSPQRVGQVLRELLKRGEVVHAEYGSWQIWLANEASPVEQIAAAATRWDERFNEDKSDG